jgi:hypothetical protein
LDHTFIDGYVCLNSNRQLLFIGCHQFSASVFNKQAEVAFIYMCVYIYEDGIRKIAWLPFSVFLLKWQHIDMYNMYMLPFQTENRSPGDFP